MSKPFLAPLSTAWFRMPNGRLRLRGWMSSAILGLSTGGSDDGWTAFSSCPRCGVMVVGGPNEGEDSLITFHERWHAATDFPVPEGL